MNHRKHPPAASAPVVSLPLLTGMVEPLPADEAAQVTEMFAAYQREMAAMDGFILDMIARNGD